MCIGTFAFTVLDAATVTSVYHTGQNVDVPPTAVGELSAGDIKRLESGSKVELTAWYSYISLIWCLKFSMLFFYRRLTVGSFQQKLVTYLFWMTGVTYLALFAVVTFGCFPFHMNWQVAPAAPWKCTFRPQNIIATCVLNISTDVIYFIIPVPLLWQLKVPMKKKLVIGAILSSGLFVIGAAAVRAAVSLGANPSAANINSWGVRETFIAIFTVNVPIFRPMFNRTFWSFGTYLKTSSKSRTTEGTGRATTAKSAHGTHGGLQSVIVRDDAHELGDVEKGSMGSSSGERVLLDGQIIKSSKVVQVTTEAGVEEDEDELLSPEERNGRGN